MSKRACVNRVCVVGIYSDRKDKKRTQSIIGGCPLNGGRLAFVNSATRRAQIYNPWLRGININRQGRFRHSFFSWKPVQPVIRTCVQTAAGSDCVEDRKSTRLNSSHSQISYA